MNADNQTRAIDGRDTHKLNSFSCIIQQPFSLACDSVRRLNITAAEQYLLRLSSPTRSIYSIL